MRSEIAFKLLDPELGICIVFSVKENVVKMSVRGKPGSKLSALEVAQSMGGNGHRDAAGTKPIPLSQFVEMVVTE